jgi:hypothetical protein
LFGADSVGAGAVLLPVPLFDPLLAPRFLVLDGFFDFDLLCGCLLAGWVLAPEVVCVFSSAISGRGAGAALGFAPFEPPLPLWPEAPVEPDEPDALDEPDVLDEPDEPDEPVVLDSPLFPDEPAGVLCGPVDVPDGVVEPVEVFSEATSDAPPVDPDGAVVVEVGPVEPEAPSAAKAALAAGP